MTQSTIINQRPLQPFHLAFPVADLADARAFYDGLLGCPEGRSSPEWVDFDFFGHQLVAHLAPEEAGHRSRNPVDGHDVPVRHFGVVLSMDDWHALAERLTAAGTTFVIEPYIRFKGEVGEDVEPFSTKLGAYYTMHVNGQTPPKLKPLDQVRAQALADWTAEQKGTLLAKRAQALAAQAAKDKSLDAIAQAPPDPDHPNSKPPARIVLLSDGKSQIGRPSAEAAKAARDQKVPIYTIAYGTPDGTIEVNGTYQPVPVDRQELATVAKISGGEAYRAQSAGELKDVYKDIGSSVGKVKVDKEVTSRWAGFGLAFAILAALGMISLGARWP